MVPDRQKVRTDGMEGRTHGRRQDYIPPTKSEDNKCATFDPNIPCGSRAISSFTN